MTPLPSTTETNGVSDENCESRLYIGNLDQRVTECQLIKMFSPFGNIVSEDFLWHTRGPRRGEPRGYAFIQYSCKEDAVKAKETMNGRPAFGRPLVVRLASEKLVLFDSTKAVSGVPGDSKHPTSSSSSGKEVSRSSVIMAIKNKLRSLEDEKKNKKPRQTL